jgi:hypothetical protein
MRQEIPHGDEHTTRGQAFEQIEDHEAHRSAVSDRA